MNDMKVIGMIGGMSWESTLDYYRLINAGVKARLGGLSSARIIMYSVNFGELEPLMGPGRWDEIALTLSEAAKRLEAGGADFFLICTNTMHIAAPQVEAAVSIPLVHIADSCGRAVSAAGLKRVGLLGTRFTMEEPFLKDRLASDFDLEILTPDAEARLEINRIIFEELCLGRIQEDSKRTLVRVGEDLIAAGAEGVILGCTELQMLLKPADVPVDLFDTTALHAEEAVCLALGE